MGNSNATPHIQSSASRSEKSTADESNSVRCKASARDAAASATPADKATEETTYLPIFANIAKVMCQNGAAYWQLALAFQVDESIIHEWKRTHKAFATACKYGTNFANDTVERSLYQLARGYDYRDVKIFCNRGRTIYASYTKHVVASVEACIFWLVNRRPDEWSHLEQAQKKVKPESELGRAMDNMKFDFFRPKED